MVEMFFGLYGLLCWLIFKKFKLLPVNTWTVVTAIFIAAAVLIFGFIILGRFQPMTRDARTFAITTPIVAEVQGRVTEVVAEGGHLIKQGEVLFRVDPEPFEAAVASIEAELDLAETRLDQETQLSEAGAGSRAGLDRARADVNRLKADLRAAQFRLESATVRAPADGFVTQVAIRPGQFVMPMAFAQVMVFVHAEGPYLVATFPQNAMEFIDAGDEAEVAFDGTPGRVFSAKVLQIQPLLAEAELNASGRLRSFADVGERGRMPVLIEITEDISELNLPAGSNAHAAVFTGKHHHLDILRKIILRIKSWENWVTFSIGLGH